jgi:hypothetical protein
MPSARAREEMDDEEKARHERLLKEQKELQDSLEHSRERVGVRADDLQRVVGAALTSAGCRLNGHNQLPKIILGIKFTDGIEMIRSQAQIAAA